MLTHKRTFVVAFGLCLIASNAVAAPTVKKLGGGTSFGNTNAVSTKATDGQNLSRASSIRSVSANVKPATITKKVSDKENNNVITSRLTVGKYLHNKGVASGIIKPNASYAESQSNEIVNLTDRVVQLENQMDGKQQVLSAGDGIVIENNVISVDTAVNTLPDKVETITEQLDENYYTKSEVKQLIETQEITGTDTIYDSETGERIYVSIVDNFDKKILN